MAIGNVYPPYNVCMLGDSITSQFSSYLSSMDPPYRFMNLQGVSGNTMSQIAARVGSVPGGITHLIVEGGTNDLFGLADASGIIPGYTTILNAIPQSVRVIVMGVAPFDATQLNTSWGGSVGLLDASHVNAVHFDLIDLCASYKNAVPAMASMLGNQNGLTSDGIHAAGVAYYQNLFRLTARYMA